MYTLLFTVLICGIFAWVIYSTDIPQPFKNGAIGILLIIMLIVVFRVLLGVDLGIPIK